MTNKQQIKTKTFKKDHIKKLPQLQKIRLERLDGVAGGLFANPFA